MSLLGVPPGPFPAMARTARRGARPAAPSSWWGPWDAVAHPVPRGRKPNGARRAPKRRATRSKADEHAVLAEAAANLGERRRAAMEFSEEGDAGLERGAHRAKTAFYRAVRGDRSDSILGGGGLEALDGAGDAARRSTASTTSSTASRPPGKRAAKKSGKWLIEVPCSGHQKRATLAPAGQTRGYASPGSAAHRPPRRERDTKQALRAPRPAG